MNLHERWAGQRRKNCRTALAGVLGVVLGCAAMAAGQAQPAAKAPTATSSTF
jgi:hypothetical protein